MWKVEILLFCTKRFSTNSFHSFSSFFIHFSIEVMKRKKIILLFIYFVVVAAGNSLWCIEYKLCNDFDSCSEEILQFKLKLIKFFTFIIKINRTIVSFTHLKNKRKKIHWKMVIIMHTIQPKNVNSYFQSFVHCFRKKVLL